MQLKIKTSEWAAGIPVSMLNHKTAQKLGVHAGDRITIKTISKNSKQMTTIVDTVDKLVGANHIAVSEEVKKILSLREEQTVDVSFMDAPESVNYIKKKLVGEELTHDEVKSIIADVVNNTLSEPEVSVFVSAMYKNGMTFKETVALVDAILSSGKTLSFRNKYVVDKHCIGGIAGNRTTPIVVSICAAAGLTFPKTSSRAITSAAGTADCIEVLSPVEFSMDELKKIVQKTGACLTWGGALGMVPADSKIIKVEKMLKLDPAAQLLASIMSKKLAAGSKYILIDIPYGKKAKVSLAKGKMLKRKFEQLARHFKVKIKVILTKATEPIGNGVGPALEIRDVMNVLNPKKEGPQDLEKKAIYLASEIFEMTISKKGKGKALAREMLESGKAWKKFQEIIKAQNGRVKEIIPSKISHTVCSPKKGKIKDIDNHLINYLARVAGCPMDKYSGVYLHHHIGDKVKHNEPLLTIYAESKPRLKEALKYYENKKPIRI
ncbi:thymidine phosphorylase family protein [archaeon]|nr:thymidine phosphorylase family protein [archaeon]